jgi:hypothetical protein
MLHSFEYILYFGLTHAYLDHLNVDMPALHDIVSLKPIVYVPPEPSIFVSPTTPHAVLSQILRLDNLF